jgi:protein-tyrosine phosphatase
LRSNSNTNMFSFFSRENVGKNAFEFLKTDMHSHLLPQVDDGSTSLEDSMHLISGLVDLGFQKIITTPHIYEAFYKNDKSTLKPPFELISEKVVHAFPQLEFSFAAEYFADEFFEKKVIDNDFSDKHILLEISFVGYSQRIEYIVFDLVTRGYKPILAHPERYFYLSNSLKTFKKIRQLGCELQLNINSLSGYYGSASEELALKLLDEKLVSYLGTDMHHEKHLNYLQAISKKKRLMKSLRAYPWGNVNL